MGAIVVDIDLNANDVPAAIRYADWTDEELRKSIEEDEKNPPKTWQEAVERNSWPIF